ncbi:TonB-dependent receptor [Zunongwangia endophytica]|uniref:TonB-dependent receptor domain-containing protein n=1 Tax=Zunongwangia endophytica TaxID=1808945 RepID=A0ABV8H2J8_9FLAO|nr:TonB-dependent receptor [Zunongwangia endophytica]MDN3596200.1 carboxypeptidase-like regulatory domain-containing protein [Zunongwangia endophytica]
MNKFLVLIAFLLTIVVNAQETTGSIAGKLTDREMNGEPLAFANVTIKGTSKGTTSDYDGLYVLNKLEPGTYTVVFSFVGYETLEIPNVQVVADKVTEINTDLGASAASLDEVVITTVSRRDSEVALLLEQKGAIEMIENISAQELARKGVGDAQGALTKMAGVSKQEGVKNVFVRGLGDRYNSTTLNGLPLPSEDPEYKNVALDFFDSNIINSVGINKTFQSSLYGDFAGANIDIISKELYGKETIQLGIGSGINTRAVSKDFETVDGGSWFGYGLSSDSPISSLDNYSFENSLAPNNQNSQVNLNANFQIGKKFDIGENSLKTLLIGSFDSKYSYNEGNTKEINAQGLPLRDLDFQKYQYNVSQILMANVDYGFGDHNIGFNSLYIHNNNQSVGNYFGQSANISEETDDSAYIKRQQINDNTVLVNQILSEFTLTDRINLEAKIGYNITRANEPDRRQNTFVYNQTNDNYRVAVGTPGYNLRFFSELEENEIVAHLKTSYNFGVIDNDEEPKGKIDLGYDYRNTDRRFDFLQFNHDFGSPIVIDRSNPDLIFNQQNLTDGTFRLVTNSGFGADFDPLDPFFYEGEKDIHAGFASAFYQFSESFTLNAGLRLEHIKQYVNWDTNLSSSENNRNTDPSTLENTYLLPSFTGKYNFNENSILRLTGSKTYTYPQFKEVAPFLYENVNFSSFGNPDLEASDNYNLDLKYEFYFGGNQIISLTGFYKKIIDPINRVQVNSAANQLSYINSGEEADVAGAELEVRKTIFNLESSENRKHELAFGLNTSYLYSRQDLSNRNTNFTNSEDELEGASPWVLNTDLTYNYDSTNFNLMSSVVLNYFSDRIYSLGVQQQGNIVETGIPTLDFIAKGTISKHWGVSAKVQNILDPEFQLTQDDINGGTNVINNFNKGIVFSLGLSYSL